MTTQFGSPDASALGGFVASPLGARNRGLSVIWLATRFDERLDPHDPQRAPGNIYEIDPAGVAEPIPFGLSSHFTNLDAIEVLPDGSFLVSDFKGKVLLVDFWATWCGPCIMEMPDVVRLHKKYKGKGLRILGVSLDHPDSKDRIVRTMKDNDMKWPVIYDGKYWQAEAAVMNNVHSIPMMYLIDRNGKGRYAGLHGQELEDAIKELLNEK